MKSMFHCQAEQNNLNSSWIQFRLWYDNHHHASIVMQIYFLHRTLKRKYLQDSRYLTRIKISLKYCFAMLHALLETTAHLLSVQTEFLRVPLWSRNSLDTLSSRGNKYLIAWVSRNVLELLTCKAILTNPLLFAFLWVWLWIMLPG